MAFEHSRIEILKIYGGQIMSLSKPTKKTMRGLLASSASAVALLSAMPAHAAIDEVVVTVTKRAETLDVVPIAATAVTGDFIRDVNIDDAKDLIAFTPGATGNSADSFIDLVAIRGVKTQDFGIGGDYSIGFFKNGLYLGRNGSALTTMFDMDRAEMLRGPQNFLLARNAIAGAFSVHTKRPDIGGETEGFIELDIGERSHYVGEGAVNIPVSDKFAMRIAGIYSEEDGWMKNLFDGETKGGHEKWAARLSADYVDGPLSVQFTAEYEDRDKAPSYYRMLERGDSWVYQRDVLGVVAPADGRDINQDAILGDHDKAEVLGIGLRVDYDLDFATLTSQTGWTDHTWAYGDDFDGLPLIVNAATIDQEGTYFEQEVRLVSNDNGGPFSWYVGASYYSEDLDSLFNAAISEELYAWYYACEYYVPGVYAYGDCVSSYLGLTPVADGLYQQHADMHGENSGWAAFVDVNYQITDTFDVGVGVRYTRDEKEFTTNVPVPDSEIGPGFFYAIATTAPVTNKESWNATTPRVIARYRPNDDHMFYASATRGFKAGGHGSFSFDKLDGTEVDFGEILSPGEVIPHAFGPEKMWSYEIGHKGTFFDGRIKTDLIYYTYDFEDLQFSIFPQAQFTVENLGEVEAQGVEAEIQAELSDMFDMRLGFAWNDTEVSNVQTACDGTDACEGNRLPTPEWSGSFVLNAHKPINNGELIGSVAVFWEDEKGGDISNDPEGIIDSFYNVSVTAGYQAEDWSLIGYVENATDELYYDEGTLGGGLFATMAWNPSRPRTFGVRFTMNFGG